MGKNTFACSQFLARLMENTWFSRVVIVSYSTVTYMTNMEKQATWLITVILQQLYFIASLCFLSLSIFLSLFFFWKCVSCASSRKMGNAKKRSSVIVTMELNGVFFVRCLNSILTAVLIKPMPFSIGSTLEKLDGN